MRIILMTLLSAGLFAQISETLEVIYRDVRVHVVDKKGQPVHGLGQEAFLLQIGKQVQSISFFEEINYGLNKTSEKEAAIRSDAAYDRTVVIYFDTSNLSRRGFEELKTGVQLFIKRLDERDFVKIIHFDQTMTDLGPFTKDRRFQLNMLDDIEYQGAQYRDLRAQEREIIDAIAEYQTPTPNAGNSPAGQAISEALAGQKEVLAAGVDRLVEQKEQIKAQYFKTFYQSMFYVSQMLQHMSGSKSIFLFSGGSYLDNQGSSHNTYALNQALCETLNQSGATIYSFLHKELGRSSRSFLNAAVGTSLNFTQLEQGASFSELEGYSQSLRNTQNTILENEQHLETGLREPSQLTGGFFEKNTQKKNLEVQIDSWLKKSSHFYRFVFPLEGREDERLTVSLPNHPDLKLVYGNQFSKERAYRDYDDEEKAISLRSLLYFNRSNRNDLDVSWNIWSTPDPEEGWRTVVMGKMNFEEKLEQGYEAAFALLDEKGQVLDSAYSWIKPHDFGKNFPKSLTFYDVLLSRQAPPSVRTILREREQGTLSIEEHQIHPPNKKGILVSGLVFSLGDEFVLPLNHRRKLKNPDVLEGLDRRVTNDPLWIQRQLFKPTASKVLNASLTPVFLQVRVDDLDPSAPEIQFLARGEAGFVPLQGKVELAEQNGNVWSFSATIDLSSLAGPHKIWVKASQKKSEREAIWGQVFEINKP